MLSTSYSLRVVSKLKVRDCLENIIDVYLIGYHRRDQDTVPGVRYGGLARGPEAHQ